MPRSRNSRPKGTRSVSDLTPLQLSRKRANDREAQRAIRARTREQIDGLEQELEVLKGVHGRDKTVQDLLRRNKALEEELNRFKENLDVSLYSLLCSAPAVYDDNISTDNGAIPSPKVSPLQYVPPPSNCETWATIPNAGLVSNVPSPSSSSANDELVELAYIPTSQPQFVQFWDPSQSQYGDCTCGYWYDPFIRDCGCDAKRPRPYALPPASTPTPVMIDQFVTLQPSQQSLSSLDSQDRRQSSSSLGAPAEPRRSLGGEDWEPFKGTIRKLYLEERWRLKDVRSILYDNYGFQATLKMYMLQCSKWQFVKRKQPILDRNESCGVGRHSWKPHEHDLHGGMSPQDQTDSESPLPITESGRISCTMCRTLGMETNLEPKCWSRHVKMHAEKLVYRCRGTDCMKFITGRYRILKHEKDEHGLLMPNSHLGGMSYRQILECSTCGILVTRGVVTNAKWRRRVDTSSEKRQICIN